MKLTYVLTVGALTCGLTGLPAAAQVKQDLKQSGHALKRAGQDLGNATKDAGQDVVQGAEKIGHEAKVVTEKGVHKAAGKTEQAAKTVKQNTATQPTSGTASRKK